MNHEFDHTNPEHHLEIADAIRAIEETKSLQSVEYLHTDGVWRPNNCTPAGWNKAFRHRRAPVPTVKYWSEPNHVPCPCWVKFNTGEVEEISSFNTNGAGTRSAWISWDQFGDKEWSPTHLGPFKPCTIPSQPSL